MLIPQIKLRGQPEETCLIRLSQVTLIGGLNNSGKTRTLQAIEKEAKKTNEDVRVILPYTRETDLVYKYEQIIDDGHEHFFLSFLQLVDESIKEVRPRNSKVLIDRAGKLETLSDASHALNRLAMMALDINNNELLLIDEIENGLHKTCYEDLWINLFESAYHFDAQIVATTQSLEMIEEFAKAAIAFAGRHKDLTTSSYIEITRSAKTNAIVAIKRDAETVIYAIEHGKGIRGER
jgi:predicted ATP-dependent endonuclease of OLD family